MWYDDVTQLSECESRADVLEILFEKKKSEIFLQFQLWLTWEPNRRCSHAFYLLFVFSVFILQLYLLYLHWSEWTLYLMTFLAQIDIFRVVLSLVLLRIRLVDSVYCPTWGTWEHMFQLGNSIPFFFFVVYDFIRKWGFFEGLKTRCLSGFDFLPTELVNSDTYIQIFPFVDMMALALRCHFFWLLGDMKIWIRIWEGCKKLNRKIGDSQSESTQFTTFRLTPYNWSRLADTTERYECIQTNFDLSLNSY